MNFLTALRLIFGNIAVAITDFLIICLIVICLLIGVAILKPIFGIMQGIYWVYDKTFDVLEKIFDYFCGNASLPRAKKDTGGLSPAMHDLCLSIGKAEILKDMKEIEDNNPKGLPVIRTEKGKATLKFVNDEEIFKDVPYSKEGSLRTRKTHAWLPKETPAFHNMTLFWGEVEVYEYRYSNNRGGGCISQIEESTTKEFVHTPLGYSR